MAAELIIGKVPCGDFHSAAEGGTEELRRPAREHMAKKKALPGGLAGPIRTEGLQIFLLTRP
jgi:hypothetical protein